MASFGSNVHNRAQTDLSAPGAISVEEYLRTVYRPDCDYVDGEVIERSAGEFDHASIQSILTRRLWELARTLRLRVLPEMGIRVSAARFRIPDICVMLKSQAPEPVLTRPPFVCIEVISPDDRMSRVTGRVKEFLAFGVNYVWIVDPESRTAYSYTKDEGREVRDRLTTANPDISISLPELFAELDEASKVD